MKTLQVEVEITGQVITAQYGTLGAGDILRTDKEFADHLVNDCGAAKYVVAQAKKPATSPAAKQHKAKLKPAAAAEPSATVAGADVCTAPAATTNEG